MSRITTLRGLKRKWNGWYPGLMKHPGENLHALNGASQYGFSEDAANVPGEVGDAARDFLSALNRYQVALKTLEKKK